MSPGVYLNNWVLVDLVPPPVQLTSSHTGYISQVIIRHVAVHHYPLPRGLEK